MWQHSFYFVRGLTLERNLDILFARLLVSMVASHTPLPIEACPGVATSNIALLRICASFPPGILTGEGQIFESPAQFKEGVTVFGALNKFAFRYFDNSRAYYRLICQVDSCPWKLMTGCEGETDIVRVKRFNNVHIHTAQDVANYKPVLRAKQLGALVKNKIMDSPSYLPNEICNDFFDAFSINMSYKQGWRAKEHAKQAIYGKPENSYLLVPWICQRLVESIPNTQAFWTSDDDGRFKQLFVAYGCSIMGFLRGCRPILFIDGCFLSGPYKGHLVSATAHDADDGMYTVAYGVVSSENNEDWLWFLERLKGVIGEREVVLVSDRNPGLLNGIIKVFGGQYNSWCVRHLKENFSKHINSKGFKGNRKHTAMSIIDKIAYSRSQREFDKHLGQMYTLDNELGKWVTDNNPQHWSNALFPFKRWDKLYTNLAESFNEWIVEERHVDIAKFMIEHLKRTTKILLRKQTEVQSWQRDVGNNIEKKIIINQDKSCGFTHAPSSNAEFTVYDRDRKSYSVRLYEAYCSCLEWSMSGIPCPHACRAVQASGVDIYMLVEWFMRNEAQLIIYEHVMSLFRPMICH